MRPWRELSHDGVVAAALREVELQDSTLDGLIVHAPAAEPRGFTSDSLDEVVSSACQQLSALRSERITAFEFFAVEVAGGCSVVVLGHRDWAPGAALRPPGVVVLPDQVVVTGRTAPSRGRSTFIGAARPWDSIYDGRTTEEFCLELPDLSPATESDDRSARVSVGRAIEIVATLTSDRGLALWFVHAPALPPGERDTLRRMDRDCVRVGVSLPSPLDERMSFAEELAAALASRGVGLYMRQASDGGSKFDYWAQIARASSEAELAHESLSPSEDMSAVRLTAVGPARPGVTAHIVQSVRRCGHTLRGLSMTSLQGLAIINVVAGRAAPWPDQALMAPCDGRCPIDLALGRQPHDRECPMGDYQVIVSEDQSLVQPRTDASAVWLVWSIDPTEQALIASLNRARAALESAGARHSINGPVRFEYLIARLSHQGRLRCRARVGVAAGSSGFTAEAITSRAMGRFCADVERMWRREMLPQLSGRHFEVEAVWRESWIGRSSALHGAADA